jgi:hypothetical protein
MASVLPSQFLYVKKKFRYDLLIFEDIIGKPKDTLQIKEMWLFIPQTVA